MPNPTYEERCNDFSGGISTLFELLDAQTREPTNNKTLVSVPSVSQHELNSYTAEQQFKIKNLDACFQALQASYYSIPIANGVANLR